MANRVTEAPSVSWPEVCARRVERHALSTPAEKAAPVDIVAAMCGAHAQVLSAAELSIGIRLSGITHADVKDALWSEHSLIKTYGPRGTVHLLPAEDLAMWTGALSAIPAIRTAFPDGVRLEPEQVDAVVEAIAAALDDAELTIDELSDEVIGSTGPWAGELVMPAFNGMWPRWRQAISTAAHRGVLCFGINRGRKVTYTNPRRWLPGFEPADERTALAGVLRSYLHAYGPATPQQFARWLSAPTGSANALFDSLVDSLQQVDLEGNRAWVNAGDTVFPSDPVQGVRLLPYFDPYAVGSYPRELLFPGQAATRATARGQAGNFPVLLIDGIVAGVWHQRKSGRKVAITVEPLIELTTAQHDELGEQVERIGAFIDAKPQWTIGTVTTGPHA